MTTEAMITREPPALPCSVGDVIDGRYRIDALRASGGMGTVFKATHLLLARTVALKIVSSKVLKLPGGVARFLREARLATQLSSTHIVKVFDVGVLEGGTPYLVMEWLEGRDLAQVINKTGPLHVETAVDYVLQACEALAEVHARGIIHRDLKPSNLFLTRGSDGLPELKLLDFGVSKVPHGPDAGARLTMRGTVLGSPAYMSPEQMGEAETADERTDIWGVGVILYEVLTQAMPFAGSSLAETLGAILTTIPTHPSELNPSVPPALGDVILKCLKPEPADRFRDVAALAHELSRFGAADAGARVTRIRELSLANRRTPLPNDVIAGGTALDDVVAQRNTPAEASDTLPEQVLEQPLPAVSGTRRRPRVSLFAVAALAGSLALFAALARSHTAEDDVSRSGLPELTAPPTVPEQPITLPPPSGEEPAKTQVTAAVLTLPAAPAPAATGTFAVVRSQLAPRAAGALDKPSPKAHADVVDTRRDHAPVEEDPWAHQPANAAAPAQATAEEPTAATDPIE